MACLALVRTDIASQIGQLTSTAPPGLGPAQLRSAYKLGTFANNGGGETVGIVDAYNDPNAESDLAVYRAQCGLPPCTTANGCFKKVNERGQQGSYPQPDPGWAIEISLDLDMVSAICPRCHILLVEATTQSFVPPDLPASVNEAVALGAKFVSNSTTSLLPASNTRGWDEIAWSGGGSGCSPYLTKPSWQHDTGCTQRTVADVAAVADPDAGGVAVYDSYFYGVGWWVVGGTSLASPIIASVYALAGTPGANTYPASYPYVK